MKTERILSYTQAAVLSKDEIESVNGAGVTSGVCAEPTHQGGWDGTIDAHVDY